MRTRTLTTASGAALLLLALAGCGGGDDGRAVASLGGDRAAEQQSRTAAEKKDPEEAFRDFAQCMREHGVEMADPQVSDDGAVTFSAPADPAEGAAVALGPGSEMAEAQEACQQHLQGVVGGPDGEGPDAEEVARMQRRAVRFARCMRAEGIDFPDPQFGDASGGGGGMVIIAPGQAIDPDDPAFAAANEKCAEQVGMPRPGGRTGERGGPSFSVRGGGR